MVEGSRSIDVSKLWLFSNDLVDLLSHNADLSSLNTCFAHSHAVHSRARSHLHALHSDIQAVQEKINTCKQRTAEAESEGDDDTQLDVLLSEFEQREQLLREELRAITDEIDDLDRQRASIEEQRRSLKQFEQDQLRAEMKLSLYASVTSIIPNLDDQSEILGQIVEKDKKAVQSFKFDPLKLTAFDTCDSIWKMINS